MGGGSFDYVPFLGSDAPRNYPLQMTLREVLVDEESVPLDLGPLKWSSEALAQDRGVLLERYLLELDSVEQTFVLPERVRGPVRLELGVETDLAFEPCEQGAVYRGDQGAVRIGAAFAVDARGHRIALESSHRASGYTIEVPEDFLATAAYPVTIDPIVSTFDVDTFAAELTCPEVATHWLSGVACVVYVENFSATDADVYASLIDDSNDVTPFGYVDMTSERWSEPDIGCAQSDAVMLVASSVDDEVRARRLPLPAVSFEPVFRVDSFTGAKSDVTVGGDAVDRVLVVWGREFSSSDWDVFARVVTSNGTLLGTSEITIDNSPTDYRNPRVSAHNGSLFATSAAWAVVAERRSATSPSIDAARIRWTGAVDQQFFPVYDWPEPGLFPVVSSPLEAVGPKTYMTVFRRDFGSDTDIHAVVFREDQVISSTNISLSDLPGDVFDTQFPCALETNGDRFTLLWRDLGPNSTYISTLIAVGSSVCSPESVPIASTEAAACGTICPRENPRTPGDVDTLVVWEEESASPTSIRAAEYNDFFVCLGAATCTPVPNSTTLSGILYATGSGLAGEPHLLHAVNLPANQFGLFIVSATQAFNPGAGGSAGNLCLGGSIGRFQTQIVNSGEIGALMIGIQTNAIPTPTGFVSTQPGDAWYFQAWHRDVLPTGPTSNYTRALRVVFQ